MSDFFSVTDPLRFEGRESRNRFAFHWYDKDRMVLGKRMEEHLRFAVAYWHSLCWPGSDPFGGDTFQRPWMAAGDTMAAARQKADVAFDLFRLLDVPFFCFHDRDIAPEGSSLAETNRNTREIAELLGRKMEGARVKLLWGTANLFSHRRFMAGAATNPDPDVFAWSAAQVRTAMDATHMLGGQNYVLWGGREGYETLLNTDLKRELDQLGRFLNLVVEHKHKIGFTGTILIEPKPQEPTKHQYDHDVATVWGFLQQYGLEREVKVNIEANHATLAGHSFEHEIALAAALGILGSIDMNRGDEQSGWDTDQFPNSVEQTSLALYYILKAGGLGTGGLNFDAKLRRQSIDPDDLIAAHAGAMDVCARALLSAAAMLEEGALPGAVQGALRRMGRCRRAGDAHGKTQLGGDRGQGGTGGAEPAATVRQAGGVGAVGRSLRLAARRLF